MKFLFLMEYKMKVEGLWFCEYEYEISKIIRKYVLALSIRIYLKCC